jgi:hypothetical protein
MAHLIRQFHQHGLGHVLCVSFLKVAVLAPLKNLRPVTPHELAPGQLVVVLSQPAQETGTGPRCVVGHGSPSVGKKRALSGRRVRLSSRKGIPALSGFAKTG